MNEEPVLPFERCCLIVSIGLAVWGLWYLADSGAGAGILSPGNYTRGWWDRTHNGITMKTIVDATDHQTDRITGLLFWVMSLQCLALSRRGAAKSGHLPSPHAPPSPPGSKTAP